MSLSSTEMERFSHDIEVSSTSPPVGNLRSEIIEHVHEPEAYRKRTLIKLLRNFNFLVVHVSCFLIKWFMRREILLVTLSYNMIISKLNKLTNSLIYGPTGSISHSQWL